MAVRVYDQVYSHGGLHRNPNSNLSNAQLPTVEGRVGIDDLTSDSATREEGKATVRITLEADIEPRPG
jgi:hypothetical protein